MPATEPATYLMEFKTTQLGRRFIPILHRRKLRLQDMNLMSYTGEGRVLL